MQSLRIAGCALTFLVFLSTAEADLQVGLSTVDVTPRRSVPLGGYSSRFGKLSKGVHDPVKCRVIYISTGKEKLVWATLDLIGTSAEFRADVIKSLPARLSIKPRNVLIGATHNHSGPGGMTRHQYFMVAMGFFDQGLYKRMVGLTVTAITRAVDRAQPAKIGFASIEASKMSRNRRIRGGPTDPQLLVMKVTDRAGKLRALVANFAAHPTIVSDENMRISAGWPGAFCDALEKRFTGTQAIFTNGAEGDQSPRAPGGKDHFDRMKRYGVALARILGDKVARIETSGEVSLSIRYTVAKLPPSFVTKFGRTHVPLHRIRLGRAMLLSVPGELSVSIGLMLKKEARALGVRPWIVGLANDHLGYIVDRRLYVGAGYESMMNFFGPEMDRWVLEKLLLDLLPRSRQDQFHAERDPERLRAGSRRRVLRGVTEVTLRGTPYQLGFQHGWLLSKEIKAILAGLNKRLPSKLRPLLVQSKKVPQALKFMILPRVRELAMPALCVASRKMHTWVPAAQMSEMLGVAHGAGVPYEQIFLLNILPTLIEFPDPESLIEGALGCTNAVLRNKGLVHGRNLDWGFLKEVLAKHGVMFRISPGSGQALLSLGYPGIIGVFSALNEAGLSFGWESVPAPKDSSIQGSSVLLRLRDVAQRATSLKQAVRLLKRGKGTLGYHFTIADGRHAAVLEVSARNVLERRLKADLLLGCDPTRPPHAQLPSATASGKGRYNRLKQTLPGQPARAETMLRLLSDPRGQVRNGETIHQVVMMPATRTMWVRAGDLKGPAVAFSLEGPVESLEPKPTSRPSVPKRPIKPKPMPRSVAPYKAPPDLKPSRSLFRVKREPFQVTKTLLRSFPLKSYRVEFPSPFKSPHACNNTVYGFYYVPRRKAKGAVVLLPIWKGPDITFEKAVASYLVLMGFKVFIMPHAYQFERSPKGVRSGDYTISADLVRTRNAFIQTVQDARRAATWLQRDEGVKNLAVMGISLGGVMSSLVYSVDDRFKACSVILGGGDLGGLLLNSDETRKIRRSRAARQATVKQVRHALRAIEPLTYATKARGTGVMMINGTKDTSVPPANAKKLAAAFGVQPHWIPVGHYDGWTYILRMLRLSAQHMQERFLGASQK